MAKGDPISFDLDDDDLKLFCDEADEQIEILDGALVQLEGQPAPDLVQQIFRAAHTLKGSSATIGHKRMASLTHAMETVLDAVRQGKRTPNSAMVDALLEGLDALRVLAQEVVTRIDSGTRTEPLERAILAVLDQDAAGVTVAIVERKSVNWAASGVGPTVDKETADGHAVYSVEITIGPDCQLPSIRCYQLLQEMDAAGRVLAIQPDRETIEAGGGELLLCALIASDSPVEQLRASFAEISDVEAVKLTPVTADELGTAGSPPTEDDDTAGRGPTRAKTASVRIDIDKLDGLMNLVGEVVIDRTRLQQMHDQLSPILKTQRLTELEEGFEEIVSHLTRITDELQEAIMRSRMLPIRSVLTRLPRLVRDVANKTGKKVELTTAGEETELDRSVIEEISDPLVHILRNAIDHGIESPAERIAVGKPEVGSVSITAWNQETYIYLSVKDDGKGIDGAALRRKAVEQGLVTREAAEMASDEAVLQYVFFAGLSTAKVVSDVSGRGVGMDIVHSNVERLHGQISVTSTPGVGSEFIIQLPLTLATTKALMVTANNTVYAMPLVSVTEAISEQDAEVHQVAGRKTLRLRDKLLPLVDLGQALGGPFTTAEAGSRFVVAARHGDRQVAFLVDRLLGEQDVVVKSLGDLLGTRKGLTGATILGDGTLGLIVDTASLITNQHVAAVA